MPTKGFDYQAVPGDYQYRAMREGPRMQRFWHAGKLTALEHWMVPGVDAQRDLVVEIGCGSGNLLCHIGGRAARLAAVDVSRSALEFTASRLAALNLPGWTTLQAVGEFIPLSSGSAGWVVLSEVVEHLEDPRIMLREIWRVLRPGGRLFLTTPNDRSFWPVLEKMVDLLHKAPKMAGEQHINHFDPQVLKDLLHDGGWQVERLATFYEFSPFVSLLSESAARRWLERELTHETWRGMLLAAVARKPEEPV